MNEPTNVVHPYRGMDFSGQPCLDCGLSKEGPIHRVAPSVLEATENARDIALESASLGLARIRELNEVVRLAEELVRYHRIHPRSGGIGQRIDRLAKALPDDDDWAVQTALEAEGETDPGYLAHSFAIKFGLREKLTHEQAVRLETRLAEFLWAAL